MDDLSYCLERIRKHDRDLYEGNGKPALTIRIAQAEDCMDEIQVKVSNSDKKLDRVTWLLVSVLAAIVTELIRNFSK